MSQYVESLSTEFDVEFPTEFQFHVRRLFADSICFLSSSRRYYDAAVPSQAIVEPSEAKQFYYDLLDFSSGVKKPLLQCLTDHSERAGSATS